MFIMQLAPSVVTTGLRIFLSFPFRYRIFLSIFAVPTVMSSGRYLYERRCLLFPVNTLLLKYHPCKYNIHILGHTYTAVIFTLITDDRWPVFC